MIPVKNNKSLFRDERTNAILNCSNYEYENYLKIKNEKIKELEKTKKLESDVQNIKKDIDEIKNLLMDLIVNKT
jgi:hypothetical protein